MSDAVITALITGGLALIGVIISNISANKSVEKKLEIAQAVTDTKIEALTREVRIHNDFARRIPVIEERIKVENHRIEDLERLHMN